MCLSHCNDTKQIPAEDLNDGFGCPVCVCCNPFNQTLCNETCASQNQLAIYGAKDDRGCFDCQCQCHEYNATICSATCAEKQSEPNENAIDDYGCTLCECCERYVHDECIEECKLEGKVPEIITSGCKTCECICETYDKKACQANCEVKGKTATLDAVDSFDCPFCQCT